MIEQIGNLWSYVGKADAIGVTTNGVVHPTTGRLIMGAGVAKQASNRFLDLPEILGRHVMKNGNVPCFVPSYHILSFPTKNHWRDPSIPELIIQSAKLSVEIADREHLKLIVLTRPGCGNGRLRWESVYKAIAPILDNRFLVVCNDR